MPETINDSISKTVMPMTTAFAAEQLMILV